MANIVTEVSGRRRIQFVAKDGKRRTIRLGVVPMKMAQGVLVKVEQLVASSLTGYPVDDATSRWVADLDGFLADKLVAVGLIPRRESAQLGPFVDAYIESRTDIQPNTSRNFLSARNSLIEYFGPDRCLKSIKPGEGDEWRQSMVNDGLAEATISKRVKHARQFLKHAVRKRIIDRNPFEDVRAGSQRNEARLEFVDRTRIEKVLAATGDVEWRLIIALARYGGLRTPSETLALKWSDIDWKTGRMTVNSSKTAHQHKHFRVVPLFPELRPFLEATRAEAKPGSEYVITTYRGNSQNLRTRLLRTLRRAKVVPWERLFHNLRASRQTELADVYPLHVVTSWIGNSPDVASQHYLKTHEEHFQRVLGTAPPPLSAPKAAQNPAQQTAASESESMLCKESLISEDGTLQALAEPCLQCANEQIPPRGFEPLIFWLRTRCPRPLDEGGGIGCYCRESTVGVKDRGLIDRRTHTFLQGVRQSVTRTVSRVTVYDESGIPIERLGALAERERLWALSERLFNSAGKDDRFETCFAVDDGLSPFANGRDELLQLEAKRFDLASIGLGADHEHFSKEQFLFLRGQ